MADVLLLYPRDGGIQELMRQYFPPFQLLYASSAIADRFSVKIIDQRIEKNWRRVLEAELRKHPLLVGITTKTGPQIKHAIEMAGVVKGLSDVPVVFGGYHPSIFPEQTLAHRHVDAVVCGDGEEVLARLVVHLSRQRKQARGKPVKTTYPGIKGLWFKQEGRMIAGGVADRVDLNDYKMPFHLVDMKRYTVGKKGIISSSAITSRGCPRACAFCCNSLPLFRGWRGLDVKNSLELIEQVASLSGASHIRLLDENFFADPIRAAAIIRGLARRKLGLTFEVLGTADIFHLGRHISLEEMEKAGITRIIMGIESGTDKQLHILDKRINLKQVVDLNKRLSSTQISPAYNFILGFPNESLEETRSTIRFAVNLLDANPSARICMMSVYSPSPGTRMFADACKKGFIPPDSLEGWAGMNWGFSYLPWRVSKLPWQGIYEKAFCRIAHVLSIFTNPDNIDIFGNKLSGCLLRIPSAVSKSLLRRMSR